MAGTSNAYPELERDLSFHPASNTDPQKLARQQIRQFNDTGYISPLDVFSAEEADVHRDFFDGILAVTAARGQNSYSINGLSLIHI